VSEQPLEVRDNRERSRFELVAGDEVVGFADYRVEGDRVVFPHTVIDPSRRGQGLGAILVRAALDEVRKTGRSVVPTCRYVAEFMDRHPEYAALR